MLISQNGPFLCWKLFIIPCLDSRCWQSHHVNPLKRPDWSRDVFSIFFCPQKRKRKFIKTSKQILTRSEAAGENYNHKDVFYNNIYIFLNIFSFSKVKLNKQGNNSLTLFDVKWYFFVFEFLLCFQSKRKYSNVNTFSIDYFCRI